MATKDAPQRTYSHWQRPTSAGLMGLGAWGTSGLIVGMVLIVLVVMAYGIGWGVLAFLLLAAMMGVLVTKDKHQRSVLARVVTWLGWTSATAAGTHLYRSGPLGRTPWGTHQLPGLAAGTRLSEHTDAYNRPFALLYTPATSHYTVAFVSDPDGATLVDQDQQDHWVAGWSQWLGRLSEEPGVEAAQVTIETAPDSGGRLRREVLGRIDQDAPDLAQQMLREAARTYPQGSSQVRAYVCVTFTATAPSGKKRSTQEMARDLASRLPSLSAGLSATGAGIARPLTARGLCEVVRTAYDPKASDLFDQAHFDGEDIDLDWTNVGPGTAEAAWDSYRHDSGISVSWSMSSAPRGAVQSSILRRLLAPHGDIDRKRVTLFYRPLDPAHAAAVVQADLRNNQFKVTASRRPSAHDVLAARQAQVTADEEARGGTLLNFGMVVTATVIGDKKDLPRVRAAIDNLSASARIRLRAAEGHQDVAFVAGLPLGLILPRHLKVPAELHEKL
ncbi:SCO6880 family protein [Nocardiopsis terrae]